MMSPGDNPSQITVRSHAILPFSQGFYISCCLSNSWFIILVIWWKSWWTSHQEGIGIFIFNAAAIMCPRGQSYWNFWHLQELRPSCAHNFPTHKENQLWQWPSGEPQGGQRGRQVILNILQLADSTLELKFSILMFVFTFIWLIAPELFADFVTFSPSATVSGSICYDCHTHVFGSEDVRVFQVWHTHLYLVFTCKLLLA